MTEPGSAAGLRYGPKGAHTARTIMVAEVSDLFAHLQADAERSDYAAAVIDENLLARRT